MTLYEQLGKALKLRRKDDESFDDFAVRSTDKVQKISNPEWEELSNDLQVWCNETLAARENRTDLPALEGWPEAEASDGESEASGEAEEDAPVEEEVTNDDDASDTESSEEAVDGANNSGQEAATEEADAPVIHRRAKPSKEKPKVAASKTKTTKVTPKPEKAKKAMVAKSAPAKKAASGSGRIDDNDTIKIVSKTNPYREGSIGFKVFAAYKDGQKVKEFGTKIAKLTERPPTALLRFDQKKGYVKVVKAA